MLAYSQLSVGLRLFDASMECKHGIRSLVNCSMTSILMYYYLLICFKGIEIES